MLDKLALLQYITKTTMATWFCLLSIDSLGSLNLVYIPGKPLACLIKESRGLSYSSIISPMLRR